MKTLKQSVAAGPLPARLYCVGLIALSLAVSATTVPICAYRGWHMGETALGKSIFATSLITVDLFPFVLAAAAYSLVVERRWSLLLLISCAMLAFVAGSVAPAVEFRSSEILQALDRAHCSGCGWQPIEVHLARYFELELSEYVFREQLGISLMFAASKPACMLAGIALWARSGNSPPRLSAPAPMTRPDESQATSPANSPSGIDLGRLVSSTARPLHPSRARSPQIFHRPRVKGRSAAKDGSKVARSRTSSERRGAKKTIVSGSSELREKQASARWWQRLWRVLRGAAQSLRSALLHRPDPALLRRRPANGRLSGISPTLVSLLTLLLLAPATQVHGALIRPT